MPCRTELQFFFHPQISVSPVVLNSFMFGFAVKDHYRLSVSLKFIFCSYSLCDELTLRISVCTWWNNAIAISEQDWTQLWQMGTEAASPVPAALEPAAGMCAPCPLLRSQLCCPTLASAPQPEQGRTRFLLILSLVSFPRCLKIQGEQKCKAPAAFVFVLYLGSRRAFLLCLLPPPVHQLQLEPGL